MRNDDVPTPQAHIQNLLDSMSATAAVVVAGTAGATATFMANLDFASKILAVILMVLNIIWVIRKLWRGRE